MESQKSSTEQTKAPESSRKSESPLATDLESFRAELNRIAREMVMIRQLCSDVVNFAREAESEVPEKMRRFANYMHDLHDIKYMYEEHGVDVPVYIMREIERLHDRYRQLLKELNMEGGTFNKVRRDMASDAENRYDHTRLLPKQENGNGERA